MPSKPVAPRGGKTMVVKPTTIATTQPANSAPAGEKGRRGRKGKCSIITTICANSTSHIAKTQGGNNEAADATMMQVDQTNGTAAAEGGQTLLAASKTNAHKKKKTLHVRDPQAFQLYIFRVMKQIKPELAISKKAISQINQIVGDMFEEIMTEARKLTIFNKKQTLSSKEVETATKLLFPGELGKLAISQGRMAMAKFSEHSN